MATHFTVHKDGSTSVAISVESMQYSIIKQLTPFYDSDGTVNWADDNRYHQEYTVTGVVSLADAENLRATAKIVTGATYPRIVVYDKSAADYYNTYDAVNFLSYVEERVTDAERRVTCTFQW